MPVSHSDRKPHPCPRRNGNGELLWLSRTGAPTTDARPPVVSGVPDDLSRLCVDLLRGLERLRSCMKGLDADLRLYTTPLAMDDLDDVRRIFGDDNAWMRDEVTDRDATVLRRAQKRLRDVFVKEAGFGKGATRENTLVLGDPGTVMRMPSEPRTTVIPFMSTGATDGAALRAKGIPTDGILPMPLPMEDELRMHGDNERVPVAALGWATEYLYRVLSEVGAADR